MLQALLIYTLRTTNLRTAGNDNLAVMFSPVGTGVWVHRRKKGLKWQVRIQQDNSVKRDVGNPCNITSERFQAGIVAVQP